MKVKVVKEKDCLKSYEVKVGEDFILPKYNELIAKVAKNTTVEGFKKGAVPIDIVDKKYSHKVLDMVADDLFRKVFAKISEDAEIGQNLAHVDEFSPIETYTKQSIAIRFNIYTHPKVPEIQLGKIKFEVPEVVINDAEVTKYLQGATSSMGESEPVENPNELLQNGHISVIDFVGRKNGEVVQSATANKYSLEIGSKAFVPGFEDQLIGMKVGDSRTITVRFPKDYNFKDFADQDIEFDVKLQLIREKVKSEMNDDLAKKLGFESVDLLTQNIRDMMLGGNNSAIRRLTKVMLDAEIRKKYADFKVPEVFLESEIKRLAEIQANAKDDTSIKNMSAKDLSLKALQNICMTYIYRDFISREKIQAKPEDIDKIIAEEAYNSQQSPDEYKKNMESNEQIKNYIYAVAHEWAAFDVMLARVNVSKYKIDSEKLQGELEKLYAKLDR